MDFELCPSVLLTRTLIGSHAGFNTAEVLTSASREWGLHVGSLTAGNAANMKVAAKAEDMVHVGCYSHTLNSDAGKATDMRSVNALLGTLWKV